MNRFHKINSLVIYSAIYRNKMHLGCRLIHVHSLTIRVYSADFTQDAVAEFWYSLVLLDFNFFAYSNLLV